MPRHNYPNGKAREAALDALASAAGTLFMPAQAFIVQAGTPSLIGTGGANSSAAGWLLDAAAAETVTGSIMFPSDWGTVHVDLWWLNAGAGAGDVRLRCDLVRNAVASTAGTVVANTQTTATAGVQNALVETRMHTGLALAAGSFYRLIPTRVAADAADTLANDILLLGVELTRAS